MLIEIFLALCFFDVNLHCFLRTMVFYSITLCSKKSCYRWSIWNINVIYIYFTLWEKFMVELFNRSSESAVTYCPNLWS